MSTTNKPVVINYHRVWSKLPDIVNMEMPFPKHPVTEMEYAFKYTEIELRNMVIANDDLIGGMLIDSAAVEALPDNYLTELYNATVFHKSITGNLMPVNLKSSFTTSMYSLPNYVLLSAMISAIYNAELLTTDPAAKHRLEQLIRLQRMINYVLKQVIAQNPSGTRPTNPVVSSYVETYASEGSPDETIRKVFIDAIELARLEQSGWTAQSIADHWANTATQPS